MEPVLGAWCVVSVSVLQRTVRHPCFCTGGALPSGLGAASAELGSDLCTFIIILGAYLLSV